MSQTPSIAVVLEDGLVQFTIVQDWPRQLPLPHLVVVDYDIDGADEDEDDLTCFTIDGVPVQARCYRQPLEAYETCAVALSPKVVLAALGEPVDSGDPS